MTVTDRIILSLCLAGVCGLYVLLWRPAAPAAQAEIWRDGALVQSLALAQDARIAVPGNKGDSIIEVAGGRARFVHSPCTNRLCVRAGWLAHAGEMAACLPNHVSLTLRGGERRYDAISF